MATPKRTASPRTRENRRTRTEADERLEAAIRAADEATPAEALAGDGSANGHDLIPEDEPPDAGPAAELLQRAVEEAARLLDADGAMIYLLDPETGILRFAHDAGIAQRRDRRWVRRLQLPLGAGMFGIAAAERRVTLTHDYPNDTTFRHSPSADRFVEEVGLRSMVVAPLVAGDRTFGAIGTFSNRPNAFGEQAVALVRSLADHAAAAMANAILIDELARSQAELERRAETERTLREIATRISAIHDPADVIQQAVDQAARLLDAEGARIDLIDPTVKLLRWAYQSGGPRPSDDIWPEDPDERLDQGVSGKAVTENQVFVTGDYLDDDRFIHRPGPDGYIASEGVKSVMAAPLPGDRGPFGALTVYTTRADAWTDDDGSFLGALATEAAIAIQNARLIEELNSSREALAQRADAERTLREIAARITAIRDPDEILQQVIDAATRLLRASGAMINLVGVAGLDPAWAHGEDARASSFQILDAVTLEPRAGVSGLAIATGRVEWSGDYLEDARFDHTPERDAFVRSAGIRSVISAPVMVGDQATGAITVYAPEVDAFAEADAALLKALADQAAVTITNAQLIDQLERAREEVQRRADAEHSLREISAKVSAIRDSRDVLQQTVNEAARLLRGDGGVIDLLDEEAGVLRWEYFAGLVTAEHRDRHGSHDIALGKGLAGRAVLDRRVIRTGDYLDHEYDHVEASDALAAEMGIRSVIIAPILGETGAVGAIEVYATRPNAFDDLDSAILGGLADQAAIAIQNARLIEALDRSREEIRHRADAEKSLRQIAANISAIRDADAILQQTVDEARRLLRSSDVRIDLVENGQQVWAYTSARREIQIWQSLDRVSALDEGVSGKAITERRLVRVADYLNDHSFVHTATSDQFVRESGLRSVLAAPLVADGEPLGAISAASDLPDAYDDADAELLQALADQATIAIQNARLIAELQRSRTALARRADTERSLREMAGRIAELRDPDELLHQIVDDSVRLLGSDGAHLTRMSEDRTHLVPVVVAGGLDEITEAWLKSMQFPLMGGINGLAAGLGQPIWTADYQADDRIPLESDDLTTAERLGLRGMASVPLRAPEGGVIGTLAVSFREPHEFDDEQLAILKSLADHAAIAITNSSLYERVRESESAYRHLVQNSPDLVWSIDSDARFSFLSDTCERLTGWRPDELLGRHFGALVHEQSRDVAEIDWTTGMSGPSQELRGRLYLLHKDGHAIPAEFTAMGGIDDDGRFAGATGSVRDMTERERLERELRDSESRFRDIVQTTPDTLWRADADGNFVFMADSGEALFGWPVQEMLGKHFNALTAESSWSRAAAEYEALSRQPDVVHHVPVTLLRADGSTFAGEVTMIGVTEDGRFAGGQGTVRDVSERERLARELRESEERYRFLVENSPDIVFSTDAAGALTYVSETIERSLGYPPDEIIGRPFAQISVGEPGRERGLRWAEMAEDPSREMVFRYMMVHRDGRQIPFEVSARGLVRDGAFAGVYGAARDVSDRERLEKELRDSEERYRFLVENSPDIIFSTDAQGRYTYYSETVERLTGWRPDEMVGQHFSTLIDMATFADAERAWTAFADDPSRLQMHRFDLRMKGGGRMPVEVSAIGMVDADGRFAGIHGAARDISERERLERELRRSEERYRFLVQNSPDVIFSTDADGTFTYMSETLERLVGRRPEEVLGKHFSVLVGTDSQGEAGARWQMIVDDPSTPQTTLQNLVRADGSTVPVEVSAIAITDDAGRLRGITGSARDMTERVELERDLRQQAAQLAAGEERAHLARELHDSVTQALFSMTLLTRTTEMLLDRDMAAARKQLTGLRELQREALAEMRALIFELRPGNLEKDGLIHALNTHTAALQGRIGLPIVVKTELRDRLPIALEEVLYRIAQEALHNIVKHAGARQVRLELGRDGGGVHLRIVDDGRGFDPTAVPDGHLGLAGMRARAEKIGAEFEVKSRPSGGTTIEVRVPGSAIAGSHPVAAGEPAPAATAE